MKNSISPYPPNIKIKNINSGSQVFQDNKFIGEVEEKENWGNNWLARPQNKQNKFFPTKTEAVKYLYL